ncbi:hypothetical protein I312_100186 [Cryptococcus bacillisporus CA1280]|uniref:uncharacterized protein n=1 Tax=Cryptococcus bacillisporus CA1280 TaxID=1296109 RepID=UPI003369B569
MALVAFITTSLKAFACIWALVTFAMGASFVSAANDSFGDHFVTHTDLTSGNAVIAAGVLTWLYFVAVLVVTFIQPENVFISMMLDTAFLSIWFIFFLGSVASMSTLASVFRDHDRFTWGRLGAATIGLGWVMTFLLLGILLFEVVYTLINFGCSYTIWRKPFNRLAIYGNSTSGGDASAILDEANMGTVSTGVPDTHAANAIAKGSIDEQAVPLSVLTTSEGIAAPVPPGIPPASARRAETRRTHPKLII